MLLKRKTNLREIRKIFKKEVKFRVESDSTKKYFEEKYKKIKKMKGNKQLFLEISENSIAYVSIENPYDVVTQCLLYMDSDN